jgi:hypothetical protein
MRIAIGQACKNISINDFIHLCNLIPEDEVDLIFSGVKYDRMIKIGQQRNQIFKRNKDDKYLEGYTPTGQPLVFACIDSEPFDQTSPWVFQQLFEDLLKAGLNPNQYNFMSEQASLIYALQTKKFRAFRMLLNNPDIDFS